MLTPETRTVVAATAPVIAARIDTITPQFYRRLFDAHPELLDGTFSRANQRSGEQPKALAGSIVAFAVALLETGDAPAMLVERIAHKHTSLGVTPEQYQIVFDHLFAAIADDLGDAATPEIVAAWSEVYWLFAKLLIARERSLYGAQANDRVWMPWRVAAKSARTASVVELALEPADDTPVTPAVAGQFVSVRVPVADGLRQARAFTLLEPGVGRRIAVKLDDAGEVTPVLHRTVEVGDVVELSNPYGAVVPDDGAEPLVLVSAGIGCTPTLAWLEALAAERSTREVLVLHADRDAASFAFADRIAALVDTLPAARMDVRYAGDARLDLAAAALPSNATIMLCGPLGFMKSQRDAAVRAGIPDARIRYEIFGPDVWLAQPAAAVAA